METAGYDGALAAGVAIFGLWPFFFAIPMALTGGRTIGKAIAGVRVVREEPRRAGFGRSLFRDTLCRGLFLIVPLGLLFDYLWPLGDRRNQALHDKMASTYVVRDVALAPGRLLAVVLAPLVAVAAVVGAIVVAGPQLYEYTSLERDAFVSECSSGALTTAQCECRFDYLEQNLPYDEFASPRLTDAARRANDEADAACR